MRRPARLVFHAIWLVAALAGPAAAVTSPFTGNVGVDISGLPLSFGGAGTATINGSAGGTHVSTLAIASGAFATTGNLLPVSDPSAAPIHGIQLTLANGAGAFAETAMGKLGGAMPLLGAAKVCLFGPCDGGAVANVSVPLSVVGVGGRAVATGAVNVTIEGAPWTTGTAVNAFPFTPFVTTRMGFAHGPGSHASSTAAPGGSIQLVTPFVVWTNLGVDQPSIFGFVTTTLHFVPEPGPLALLAVGFALLGVRARRRRLSA